MKEVMDYVFNYETLVIVPYGKNKSKVYEFDDVFIVDMEVSDIIKNSCLYFGSSLEGRKEGTKHLINCEMKVPIIVEDSQSLIIFPTYSYRNNKNVWISYNNMLKYSKIDNEHTLLSFKQGNDITVDITYNIIDNQIIRCIKLEAALNKRRLCFKKSEN